jgi:hypothetical protein
MKKYFLVLSFICLIFPYPSICQNKNINYDMRHDLNPKRLTIAMWDFSLLFMHHQGGSYEDFDKVTSELTSRGFNTIRIDAFPLIIGSLDSLDQSITFPANPEYNWGQTDKAYSHKIAQELLSFLAIAKKKKLNIILSTWNMDCKEFPDIKSRFNDKQKYWSAWEKVLKLLHDNNLLDNILYVDLDQEFPYFSPFTKNIDNLKTTFTSSDKGTSGESLKSRDMKWNTNQMNYVYELLDSSLTHFQILYPDLRFTYSFTDFWKEIRFMGLKSLDVLELHLWLTQSQRFLSRSQFDNMNKIRNSDTNYSDYMRKITETMKSMKPMLKKDMINRMKFAKEWSEEIAAPLVTTEAWGPWWHMDNKFLEWKWLYDWCEECMSLASEYGFWGVTPWNYSHPYWENWKNIKWYKKVNERFLKK